MKSLFTSLASSVAFFFSGKTSETTTIREPFIPMNEEPSLLKRARTWAGRMYRKITSAQPAAGYHRLSDAKNAVRRYERYYRSPNFDPRLGAPRGFPRHILGNYILGRRQIAQHEASRA